jgi:hypothetical protein
VLTRGNARPEDSEGVKSSARRRAGGPRPGQELL